MDRRVTRSQLKVKPKREPKAPEKPKDTMSVPQPKPSTSNAASSSTVKSGPCSTSSSLPTTVNANNARTRKMKGEQVKASTAEAGKSELPPTAKKMKTNDNDKEELNLDLSYSKMLPPEVWEIVFNEVRDPLDFQALINSSAGWRKLLEKERTKFLFPLVFPILLEKSEVTIGDFKDYRAVCKTWDRGIKDYVERYYRNAFLSSMKMSGEMEAVNEKFEDDDPRINENYNQRAKIEYNLSAKHYVFVTAEKMDNFLETFNLEYQQFKRNPILSGCVVISDFRGFDEYESDDGTNVLSKIMSKFIHDDDDYEIDPGAGFLQSSKSLLTFFGEHIHYLTLELGHVYSSTLYEFQSNVFNWLKDVPNLKGLILKYKADGRNKKSESLPLQEPPKLARLQFLEVYNVPGVVFDGIVAKATSLRKVSIQLTRQCAKASYADYFKPNPRFGEGPQMPLSMLNMNIRSRNDLVNLESSLQRGISLKIETLCMRFYKTMEVTDWMDREDHWNGLFDFGYKAGWNNIFEHQYMYLLGGGVTPWHDGHEHADFFYVPEIDHVVTSFDEWPDWSRLFRVVELLGAESLLKLSIRLPGTVQKAGSQRILAECPDLRLNLSKLKSLVIRIPNTTSIDFLLGMKNSLEEATLILPNHTAVMSQEDRLKERIKFNGYFHEMMRSNIWSEMPKLKKLTLRVAQKGKPAGAELKEFNYERSS